MDLRLQLGLQGGEVKPKTRVKFSFRVGFDVQQPWTTSCPCGWTKKYTCDDSMLRGARRHAKTCKEAKP